MVPKSIRILLTVIAGLSVVSAIVLALCARDLKTAIILIKDMKECEDENEE